MLIRWSFPLKANSKTTSEAQARKEDSKLTGTFSHPAFTLLGGRHVQSYKHRVGLGNKTKLNED
jgi:hypothetical protein